MWCVIFLNAKSPSSAVDFLWVSDLSFIPTDNYTTDGKLLEGRQEANGHTQS